MCLRIIFPRRKLNIITHKNDKLLDNTTLINEDRFLGVLNGRNRPFNTQKKTI